MRMSQAKCAPKAENFVIRGRRRGHHREEYSGPSGGAAGVAPSAADPALDGDRVFRGPANTSPLVRFTHRAATP
jgi:hypothetical protein